MNPKYQHPHCDTCTFHGTITLDGQKFDIYLCSGGWRRSILARFGDSPEEYKSNPLFACEELTELDKLALFCDISPTDEENEALIRILVHMYKKTLTLSDFRKYSHSITLGKGNMFFPND